ncbi:hypothetical protein JRQ81_001332 [Phrynocephalus forsythii]|uniref:RNA transcription, translation and transport factor protein n=1 Tax=Phrynocephalus forsythii TaxID=171643 RepID=A0A9Q0Y7M2_9SAUR|nr:hypothetical protein JRQ81_001332 [Phrynocephalus forsythii]
MDAASPPPCAALERRLDSTPRRSSSSSSSSSPPTARLPASPAQAHSLVPGRPRSWGVFEALLRWAKAKGAPPPPPCSDGSCRPSTTTTRPGSTAEYLKDVNCPFTVQERQETVDWLLGLAVRFEYGDNADKYKDSTPEGAKNSDNAAKSAEPLINLDVNNPDFKAGVMALANLLQIQRHDDYLVMLKAIRILVQERLSQDAVAKANQSKEGLPVALDKHILGFDTGDTILNEAAQILRLLHIEELRELQTKINEAIVAVQAIIADPKTDHRLGKVGR